MDKQQQQTNAVVVAVGGECERGGGPSGTSDGAPSRILDALGTLEPTWPELLRLAHVTDRVSGGAELEQGGPLTLALKCDRMRESRAGLARGMEMGDDRAGV